MHDCTFLGNDSFTGRVVQKKAGGKRALGIGVFLPDQKSPVRTNDGSLQSVQTRQERPRSVSRLVASSADC